jgi:hypothetical protein
MMKTDLGPVMPEILSLRRRLALAVALIGAVLLHGLALGGLIWFSSKPDASNPLAAPDLHWVSIVARGEPPESMTGAATQVNPSPVPQSINPEPAAFAQADSGGLPVPVLGPVIERVASSAIEPMNEPMDEPVNEPMDEPMNKLVGLVVKEPVAAPSAASAEAPLAARAVINPVALSESHPRAESPHRDHLKVQTEPLQRVQAAIPEASRRAFDVYLGDFSLGQRVAAMDYLFESDGGHYRLRTEGRATGVMAILYGGLLTQDSRGRVGPEGFLPERYAERRGERPARVVSFDRTTGLAEADDGSTQPLQAGVQDQLSAIWQLALIARMTPAQLSVGHEFHWPIARGRRVHSMRIVSLGEETLQPSHSAPLRTLHLALTSATAPEDGRLDVWLATDDAMQPIRMKMASSQGLVLDQVFRFPKQH